MSDEFQLELSVVNYLDENRFLDVAADFQAQSVSTRLVRQPKVGPWMAFEWLIPTAIVLAVMYLGEFVKETGKLHANVLHDGLAKLWGKVFGPKPEVDYTIVRPSGKAKSSPFSFQVSIRAKRKDGGGVILLFPEKTSQQEFIEGADKFMTLLVQHETKTDDPLTKATSALSYLDHPGWQAIVFMNPATRQLELIDYVASSQQEKLITNPLPPELL